MIAEKMIRIDVDLFNDAAQSQLNDTPIIPRRAAAAGFPAVHPLATVTVFIGNENSATGVQEILLLREKLIVRDNCHATDSGRRQINQAGGRGKLWRNGAHLRCALGFAVRAVTSWGN